MVASNTRRRRAAQAAPANNNRRRRTNQVQRATQPSANRNASIGRGLDKCNREYAAALVDPFNSDPSCIPTVPAIPSRTSKSIARGTLSTGTLGFGFIAGMPQCGNNNSPTYGACISTSTAAYAAGRVSSPLATAGVDQTNLPTPYTNQDFVDLKVRWRPVAFGLRVRYIGTRLNMGGLLVTLRDSSNYTLHDLTFNDMASRPGARLFPVQSEKWTCISYVPVDPDDLDFVITASHNGLTRNFMAIGVQAPAATPIELQWEVCMHYESVGRIVQGIEPHSGSVQQTGDIIMAATSVARNVGNGLMDLARTSKRPEFLWAVNAVRAAFASRTSATITEL